MKTLLPFILAVLLIPELAAQNLRQGIQGEVLWLGGNQMPGPGRAQAPSLGVKREIYVHKVVTLEEMKQDGPLFASVPTELMAHTESRDNGTFKIKLPPGEYSVFIKEPGQGFFANLFNEDGQINYVRVSEKEFCWITIVVDYAAVY